MRRRLSVLGLFLATVVACQTTTPRPQRTVPIASTAARLFDRAACNGVREEVDLLLENAQEAAAGGQGDEARACEAAVFAALSRCGSDGFSDPQRA